MSGARLTGDLTSVQIIVKPLFSGFTRPPEFESGDCVIEVVLNPLRTSAVAIEHYLRKVVTKSGIVMRLVNAQIVSEVPSSYVIAQIRLSAKDNPASQVERLLADLARQLDEWISPSRSAT